MTTRPQSSPDVALADVAEFLGVASPGAARVSGITLDSRRVEPGDLYAALSGARVHGADFATAAVQSGAAAIVTDAAGLDRLRGIGVPVLVVDQPRVVLGDLAAWIYGQPARDLTMLAVTGTQGKTTTTRLLEGALTAMGSAAAVIGTTGTRIGGEPLATALTTPEAPDLHALFAVMREQGVRTCAMEVSSHALVMGRVDGVVFDVAAFTNLGRDHLDFHADLDDYFAAKASLFTPAHAARGVVNIDDQYGRRLVEESSIPIRTFSAEGRDADWTASAIRSDIGGSDFRLTGPGFDFEARVPLPGAFNVANALTALALAGEAGQPVEQIAEAMSRGGGVPGRLERIDGDGEVAVYVDYAHKPDAVTAVVRALRRQTSGRLIVVIGAGGDRDQGKRPLMGAAAAEVADVVIVTDDNPRSEDPTTIRAAVLEGARSVNPETALEIGDRHEAIAHAIAMASTGDTVLIAGKGHETGQEIDGVVHPFDDRVEARKALDLR